MITHVHPLILSRKSSRVINPRDNVADSEIRTLLEAARWAPSCSNNQPWHFVVSREKSLDAVKMALNRGNAWANNAPLIITVTSKPDLDCLIMDREYYTLGLGLAIENLLLQGIYMDLVVHPIAGFSESKVKTALRIPEPYRVHALIIIGHPGSVSDVDERTIERESKIRIRRVQGEFTHWESWAD